MAPVALKADKSRTYTKVENTVLFDKRANDGYMQSNVDSKQASSNSYSTSDTDTHLYKRRDDDEMLPDFFG